MRAPLDVFLVAFPLLQNGAYSHPFSYRAGGPSTVKAEGYKRGLLDYLRQNRPPEVRALVFQRWQFQPFPINQWVPEAPERVDL